jgi:hypothetical protein
MAVLALLGCGRLHFDELADARGPLQAHYIKSSNPDFYDQFGGAVAVSADGNTFVSGAVNESSAATGINGDQTDNSAIHSGAAYVFVRTGATWEQQAYVKASNPDQSDFFGLAVALSGDGNTLAVGATQEDSAATGVDGVQTDNSATDSGAVYVFARNGTSWAQQAYVKASNTAAGAHFGFSVALSGDGSTLAVGALDAAGGGMAYVFVRTGTMWAEQAPLSAANADPNDQLGTAVALSADGNTLVVGAQQEASANPSDPADNTMPGAGAAYVFARSGTSWQQQGYLKSAAPKGGDFLGEALAIAADGNTVVAGAGGADAQVNNSGGAFVFTRAGTTWTGTVELLAAYPSSSDFFGHSVSMVAGRVLVGASGEDSGASGFDGDQTDESVQDSGAAYLFEQSGTQWIQTHYIKPLTPGAGDVCGDAVALSATDIVLGCHLEDGSGIGIDPPHDTNAVDSGAVYVYDY